MLVLAKVLAVPDSTQSLARCCRLHLTHRGVYDTNTRLNYTSMFKAQMDAIYVAMNHTGDVDIAVGEAGWPTQAEPGQVGVGVGVEEARDFNKGMLRVVSSGKGTPLMPNRKFETYIFSLFDEN
ncbi:hypothetical protein E2562_002932 [Oryza meyeriana var. granulata]|uniref:Glucan endo-1,3-beta-D-glucosidase n=1 Tax=Oryza meyeriana var. granulata TaxID=110450 RepID=A0A6G1DDG7_9ORYZ|nr:hypothetical protein E2562_002932 [Oryza meyeriana var. granulata]